MAGISSKAAGKLKNKEKTFQGQQFDDDLGVNYVQFKYRNHDPQIGRFIEIDPLANKYEYNSTYAFSENKVTNDVELEGLESVKASDIYNHHQSKNLSTIALNRSVALQSNSSSTIHQTGSSSLNPIVSFVQDQFKIPTNVNSITETVVKSTSKIKNLPEVGKVLAITTETTATKVNLNIFNENGIESITKSITTSTSYSKIVAENLKTNGLIISLLPQDNSQTSSKTTTSSIPLGEKLSENLINLSPTLESSVLSGLQLNSTTKASVIDALTKLPQ